MRSSPQQKRRRTELVAALFTAAAVAATASAARADGEAIGLCAPAETTFFSCPTAKERWISLCGSPPRTLQYRFGTSSRIELRYPRRPAAGAKSFDYAHYFRRQTDRTEISFANAGVDYAIFDYTEDARRRAGVRVTRRGAAETEILCAGKVLSRLAKLEGVIRCDPDNALNLGRCK